MNRKLFGGVFASFALGAALAFAQEAPPAPPVPKVEPKAAQVLRRVSDFYKGLKSFSVQVSRTMTLKGPGEQQQAACKYDVAMQRPNLLAFVLKEGKGGTLVCDGKNFTACIPLVGKYSVAKAPADFETLFTGAPETGLVTEAAFLPTLLLSDPYAVMTDGVLACSYAGAEDVAGVKCDRLKFHLEDRDWQIWAAAGSDPWVMKVSADLANSLPPPPQDPAAPPEQQGISLQVLVLFANWAANPKLPADRFNFVAPAGAQKVDSLFAAAEAPPSPLIGKPAPDFSLGLVGGGNVKLSQEKGKRVVILDFWATWCNPCRKAMPIVAAVADAFKDKGVVLYDLDEQEAPEKVPPFLKEEKLSVSVALDTEGKAGDAYGADEIPEIVIIGKDGLVKAVHVGLLPDLKTTLTSEIQAILAGKPVPPPPAQN